MPSPYGIKNLLPLHHHHHITCAYNNIALSYVFTTKGSELPFTHQAGVKLLSQRVPVHSTRKLSKCVSNVIVMEIAANKSHNHDKRVC